MTLRTAGRWTKSFLLLGAVLLLAGWLFHHYEDPPPQVKVASPTYKDVANLVTTDGMVEPTLEFQARANFPGMIERVPVELGARVSAGQLLVTMKDPFAESRIATAASALSAATRDNEDMRRGGTQEERIQLAGDLAHARTAQSAAAHTLRALEQLQQQGAASTAEVDTARNRLSDLDATLQTLEERQRERFSPAAVSATQARFEDTKVALGAAKETYNNANITSPMAGTVYSVSARSSTQSLWRGTWLEFPLLSVI